MTDHKEKPNYKAIVDAAIGKKPSLAGPDSQWITDPSTGIRCWAPPREMFQDNYKITTKMNKDHYIITEHAGKTPGSRSTFSVTKKRANGRAISYDKQFNSKQTAYRNIAANIESDLVMMGFDRPECTIEQPKINVYYYEADWMLQVRSFTVTEKLLKTRKK